MQACAQLRAAIADGVSLPVTERIQEDMPRPEDVTYFCAQTAEVEVDSETGEVSVERLVTAHDVGAVINPIPHQGQVNGGFITGFGLAMTEELLSTRAGSSTRSSASTSCPGWPTCRRWRRY